MSCQIDPAESWQAVAVGHFKAIQRPQPELLMNAQNELLSSLARKRIHYGHLLLHQDRPAVDNLKYLATKPWNLNAHSHPHQKQTRGPCNEGAARTPLWRLQHLF